MSEPTTPTGPSMHGDLDADAGVIESRVQMERLAAEDALAGRTIQDFAAPSAGLRERDLDGVTIERLDLREADCDGCRLENARLRSTDLRSARFVGALWHRVTAQQCDLTQIDLQEAQLLACELSTLRLGRADFRRARLQRTRFLDVELYSADFAGAILTKCSFEGGATASVSRVSFAGAVLVDVDLRGANGYAAVFDQALLVRCDLRGANLCEASFRGARLVGCYTEGADIDGAVLA